MWQDRIRMEGGIGWWKQITDALEAVQFLVLIMTPGAVASPTTQKEWRYARQQGVRVYPVKGVPDAALDYASLPRWMRKAHFFDLEHEWETFVNYLKGPCRAERVPFMAPDLPAHFVPRPAEFGQLLNNLLSPDRANPVAITTALHGAGGFGKTSLAAALCHNDDVVTSFDDGILWVTLGENPNVLGALTKLYSALTGERPGFVDEEDAAVHLAERIHDKNCLVVIDDVWNAAHLRPFLRGAEHCGRLITTRNFEIATEFVRVNVDEMRTSEAVQLLTAGLGASSERVSGFGELARRLGEWPLLLELVGAALRQRIASGDTVVGAIEYVNRALDRHGVVAFDQRDAKDRTQAVNKTIQVSLDLLSKPERERYIELAVFPEDVEAPVSAVSSLWQVDAFAAEELIQRLHNASLLKFDIESGTIRLHDVMRAYLAGHVADAFALHSKLVDSWGSLDRLPDAYAWRWIGYHLVNARREEDLRRLLLDFNWLQAKLDATDPGSLITDFGYVTSDSDLSLVQGALRLAAHVVGQDKTQLAGQLLGRLSYDQCTGIGLLLDGARGWDAAAWLRPVAPTLTAPGGELLRTLAGHWGGVAGLAIFADGHRVISASLDGTLKIWDLATGSELRTLRGHAGSVLSVAVTADGHLAVSASSDGMLKVWNLESGAELYSLDTQNRRLRTVVLTPSGDVAVSQSDLGREIVGEIIVWSLEGRMPVSRRAAGVSAALAVTPDGHSIVSGAFENIAIWNSELTRISTLSGHRDGVTALAVAANGRWLLSGSRDCTAKIWDLETNSERLTLCGHTDEVTGVAITADGSRAATASNDRTVRIWNLGDGTELLKLRGHARHVNHVAFSPDGRLALSASDDRTIKVWDLARAVKRRTGPRFDSRVTAIAIRADGQVAVSASADHTIRVWDAAHGKQLRSFRTTGRWIEAIALAGTRWRGISTSSDGTLRVRDLKGDKEGTGVRSSPASDKRCGHQRKRQSRSVCFSRPDNEGLVSAVWRTAVRPDRARCHRDGLGCQS